MNIDFTTEPRKHSYLFSTYASSPWMFPSPNCTIPGWNTRKTEVQDQLPTFSWGAATASWSHLLLFQDRALWYASPIDPNLRTLLVKSIKIIHIHK